MKREFSNFDATARGFLINLVPMEPLGFGKLSVKKRHAHFIGQPGTLGLFLDSQLKDVANTSAQWLIKFGAVYVNQERVLDIDRSICDGDVIRVHLDPKRYTLDKENVRSRILSETEHYVVVDKPSGLPMHPTLDNFYENLLGAFDFPVFVTHRLDVPTSGVVLVAKTKEYQKLFNKLVTSRKVFKSYKASVNKPLLLGEWVHYMEDTVKAPKVFSKEIPEKEVAKKWLECRLIVKSCSKLSTHLYELEIELLTGRTHQIRGQLAFEGAPIVGDEMYGGRASPYFGLKATSLAFVCPVTDENLSFNLTK